MAESATGRIGAKPVSIDQSIRIPMAAASVTASPRFQSSSPSSRVVIRSWATACCLARSPARLGSSQQTTTSTALLANAVPEGYTADSWMAEV